MYAINTKEMIKVIHDVVIDMNSPVLFHGGSGIGKSQVSHQAMALYLKRKAYLVDTRLGQQDTVDIRGLPNRAVVNGIGLTVWDMAEFLPFEGNPLFDEWGDDSIIVLFLDEFDHASQAVAGMAYQMVMERRLGKLKFRDNVRIMAARNRPKDKGVSGGRMPEPLNRRFTHFELVSDVDTFVDYINDTCEKPNFEGNIMGRENAANLIAFLTWRKAYLDTWDAEKPEICVGSPRTWERSGCFLNIKNESVRDGAIAGAVGDGRGSDFLNFIRLKDKILPISRIIKDPLGVPLPEAPDMQYATTVSVSGHMAKQTMGPLYKFMTRMTPEFVILSFQLALKRDTSLYETNEFLQFSKTYKEVFSR